LIGFDRPLRPAWIYDTLKLIEAGAPISSYNIPFEDIAKELTGKEGKRKVRTVLFRSFITSVQSAGRAVEQTFLMDWVKKYSQKTIAPVFFAKLLIDYEVLRFASVKIASFIDSQGHMNTKHFMNKFIQEYGDRDVVRRSLRSFFSTLEYFGLARKSSIAEIEFFDRYRINESQTKLFLLLYSRCYLNSKMIDLQQIDQSILWYYPEMPLQEAARKYHGKEWEYIREPSREILLLK